MGSLSISLQRRCPAFTASAEKQSVGDRQQKSAPCVVFGITDPRTPGGSDFTDSKPARGQRGDANISKHSFVKLPPQKELITSEELMAHLGDCILSIQPQENSEALQLNFQQALLHCTVNFGKTAADPQRPNPLRIRSKICSVIRMILNDAMTVLSKLSTGLDVNVRFTGVSDFEYTPECIVFDLLSIPLYHGWLVDPQQQKSAACAHSLNVALNTYADHLDTDPAISCCLCLVPPHCPHRKACGIYKVIDTKAEQDPFRKQQWLNDCMAPSVYPSKYAMIVEASQSSEAVQAVGKLSYNQLVEKIITCKHSSDPNLVTEGLLAEQFLESSAAQLTYHGLCELMAAVKEGELSVFFRNNHFSTLIKHKGHLYLLVTDQGFLQEEKVIWESLHNVEGDSCFCDSDFHLTQHMEKDTACSSPQQLQQRQVDQDYMIALSLQQQQQGPLPMSDLELARQLQKEEYQQQEPAAQAPPQSPQQVRPQTSGRPSSERRQRQKESDCVLL
ncbi:unnamed protein product [Ranitomeya imitator]|uniref:Ubiquitin carboxyl-terminal hydrolase n=1 Tax=Ranitomeya imitator TaxID=111125 RepID=A0ABN9LA28_9NEOB|nr:unnamed protein product [Ranitomeya imitator]